MALNPLTGTDDSSGGIQSDIDRMNALALGPMYAPRDPAAETARPIGAGAGEPTPVPTTRAPEETAPGEASRVSTRIPWSKPALAELPVDPHATSSYEANITAAQDSANAYAKNAAVLRGTDYTQPPYPDLPVKGLRNPESIVQAAVNHMSDNLVWLHNQMIADPNLGPEYVARASKWYDGANNIVHRLADQYGYSPEQVAAAIAVQSPQKDWFQNASLGQRVIDIMATKGDQVMTPEMQNWTQNYVNNAQAIANDPVKGSPTKQAAADDLAMSFAGMRNVPFNRINDPDTKALWLRAYDEAHNSRDHPIITPEGDEAGPALNDDGSHTAIGWGGFRDISKAIQALSATDMPTISRLLGGMHKVRSFFNNMISPNSDAGDVTADTHAIGAAHLRPFTSSDWQTEFGLGGGGSSDSATGMHGAYGLYHEAYTRAAEKLKAQGYDYLPRQLQSITWEGMRGMFPDWYRTPENFNANYDIWNSFRRGDITADQARAQVLAHAGGIRPAQWWTPTTPTAGLPPPPQ